MAQNMGLIDTISQLRKEVNGLNSKLKSNKQKNLEEFGSLDSAAEAQPENSQRNLGGTQDEEELMQLQRQAEQRQRYVQEL